MACKKNKKLVVIISDKLSVLVEKGEITERYYNPKDFFDEVHIIALNNDKVDVKKIAKTAGTAQLFVYHCPPPTFLFSLGFNKVLISLWVKKLVELIAKVNADVIRAHNNFLAGYVAAKASLALDVPFVVSLHGVWDKDDLTSFLRRLRRIFLKKLEIFTLEKADKVIAVYKPVIAYAKKHGATDVSLIYNVVAGSDIIKKTSYKISPKLKLITINRQVPEKNPENILRAIKWIDCEYLIIGDGPFHNRLKNLAENIGVQHKVKFVKSIPNGELCRMISEFDIMVSHCDYWGISKTIIEGALAGLPIIHNVHPVEPVPDLEGDWLTLCENSEAGYRSALQRITTKLKLRQELGEKAYQHAIENFLPAVMEKKLAELYAEVIEKRCS